MSQFYEPFGLVEVGYRKIGAKPNSFTIGWCGRMAETIEQAEEFAKDLIQAIEYAKKERGDQCCTSVSYEPIKIQKSIISS